jgi:GT2 family glycosyltransferase
MESTIPSFSVIIPTYQRPRQLETCLEALALQDYATDRFEVIVVDDGSERPPEEVVTSFGNRLAVVLLTVPHAGPAASRNAGAAEAKGDLLAFTDDDCAPDSGWLAHLARGFATAPDHLVGGRTLNALPNNSYSAASCLLIDYLYTYYNADPRQAHFLASNNLAVPTDRFHAIGGFDATYRLAAGEDREFCDRWRRSGHQTVYVPEAVVYHSYPHTLRAFCRQHFAYGRGAFRFRRARSRRERQSIKLEPASFYLNLLRYPFSHTGGIRAMLPALLLAVSQVANGAGFLWESVPRGVGASAGTDQA